MLVLLQSATSASSAPPKVGHSLSWLTPKALREQVLLTQGWSAISTTAPENELDMSNTYYFDGSSLRRPTATEIAASW
eukprot:1114070-Amphidinium_carterae.1